MVEKFHALGLRDELLQAIVESGYTEPTSIQEEAIPALIAGRDVIGQAQTGTGKTAAFALPLLHKIDPDAPGIQALIMTPTRELAAQVSNNIFKYGKFRSVHVLPIYGGTSYDRQLRRLEKGIHVVIGTPGRLLDLIERGALRLDTVWYLVLDEADEMLKMGFIDDVEKIMSYIPKEQRQTALFSATISDEVRRLANRYMRNPQEITIARKTMTVAQTEQRYYMVHADSKLAALSRLLETEEIHSALIFTRTRTGSSELAEALLERGYIADALHGELNQPAREAVLRRFRNGQLPILVATDVVARGVDISDVSHVFNYDMPYDAEDYVHRIGRTGRAGRSGVAITLITPQERRRLITLEQFTKQKVTQGELPKPEAVIERREQRFVTKIQETLNNPELDTEIALIERLITEGYDAVDLAAAAVQLARSEELRRPIESVLPVREERRRDRDDRRESGSRDTRRNGGSSDRGGERNRSNGYREREGGQRERGSREGAREGYRNGGGRERSDFQRSENPRRPEIRTGKEAGMVRLMLNQGHNDGIRPRDIVGAIASESGIPGKAIGAIDIQNEFTYVDVEAGHVDKVLKGMHQWKLRGKMVKLSRSNETA